MTAVAFADDHNRSPTSLAILLRWRLPRILFRLRRHLALRRARLRSCQFSTPLSSRCERFRFLVLVALCTQEPKCQPARVVPRTPGRCGIAYTQRALLSCLLPSAPLHNNADQDADRLSKSLTATWVNAAQESIDDRHRLQLPHDCRQRSAIVMDFRILHPPLPTFVVKKLDGRAKRAIRTADYIRKCPSLSIRHKIVECDGNFHA
jgi:hypothetical protein